MFIKILSYDIFSKSKKELLNYIEKLEKVNIISGNPEVLFNGLKDERLFKAFTSKEAIIIPDGVGTVLVSKILKTPVKEKIAGIEVMDEILKICAENNKGVYLVGAEEKVLEACIKNIKAKYKSLNILGSHNGFFDMNNCEDITKDIIEKKPFALFVAMGSPRQDIFIINNINKFPCKVFMGVGGSFDVFANKVKRAPKWMISLGLEWLYRALKEPFRIKRLAVIPKFLIKAVLHKKSS